MHQITYANFMNIPSLKSGSGALVLQNYNLFINLSCVKLTLIFFFIQTFLVCILEVTLKSGQIYLDYL